MKTKVLLVFAVLLAVMLTSPLLHATQATLIADTYISSSSPSLNYCTAQNLKVSMGWMALLNFSLSSLPAGTTAANVQQATLTLYVGTVQTAGAIDFYQVASSWKECGVTHATGPTVMSPAFARAEVPSAMALHFVSVDVTSLVQDWVTSPGFNQGIAILAATTNPNTVVQLDSQKSTSTSHAARLDITLANSGTPGPQGPPGVPGPATVTLGAVTMVAAGSAPQVTNSGTPSAAVLNFALPSPSSSLSLAAPGPIGGTTPAAGTFTMVNNIASVDNAVGAEYGAKANAALAAASVAEIAPGIPTASTLITIPKGETLRIRGKGTFTNVGIRFSDSTTDTTGTGAIECPEGATLRLANGANTDVISQTNFGTLTGTSSIYGVFHATVRGCIIDGNKATNASGYGVRLFGRAFKLEDLTIQNCASGGQWTEGVQTSFADSTSDLEATVNNVHSIKNGGTGWTHKGPNDLAVSHYVAWGNSGWGIDNFSSIFGSYFNVYNNSSGGLKNESGGAITATASEFDSQSGYGVWITSGAGASLFSSTFAFCNSCVSLEIDAPNQVFHGSILGAGTPAAIGVKFNGGSADLHLNMGNLATWFDCTSEIGNPIIDVAAVDGRGTVKGTNCWTGLEYVRIGALAGSGGTNYFQIPGSIVTAGGWTATFPALNGYLPEFSSSTPTVGQTVCIKSNAPLTIGYCSTTSTNGTCTCN